MHTAPHTTIRELAHRHADGIDVRLLWNPQTSTVSVAVQDRRLDESLTFDVNPREALAAFHHPYAYANNEQPAQQPHALLNHEGERHEPHLV